MSKFENEIVDHNYGSAFNQINMIKGNHLHLLGYTGTGMTIAVLDAGFLNVNTMGAFQKLRNDNNILEGYDFVNRNSNVYANTTSNHGTSVLSTMAGFIQDRYVGTAPDASYYLFVTEDASSENPVEESYWVEAVERADSLGVQIINTSLGYKTYDNPNYNHTNASLNGYTTFITRGANVAFEKALLLINSSGNEGNRGVNAPADSPYVLSVGAVAANGAYALFSSIGSANQPTRNPDVMAQGQASFIVETDGAIGTFNGTSFSAPILAGGIACLWQALPNKTNAEIMQIVRESASQYKNPNYFLGYGIPNLLSALKTELIIEDEDSETILLFPNPMSEKFYFKVSYQNEQWICTLYDILGRQIRSFPILDHSLPVDMSNLVAGMYLVKMESPKISRAFKIVKN